ncbi:MAG: hypothetical protein Q4B32_00885 [Clostridia bacterium]|nr:hypothetical protein [Clostridia bacterium]
MYFSKAEFNIGSVCLFHPQSRILLNVPEKELSYQKFACRHIKDFDCFVANGRNHFTPTLMQNDSEKIEVQYSYALHLTEDHMRQILPLCVVEDFEVCRHWEKDNSRFQEFQYTEDECCAWFLGMSDSAHPLFRLPMHDYYNELLIGPCEKLCFHLCGMLRKTACGRRM